MSAFSFLPETLQHVAVSVTGMFVGEGWHLTLGALFMLIVIFLPGGIMEGLNRLWKWGNKFKDGGGSQKPAIAPAE